MEESSWRSRHGPVIMKSLQGGVIIIEESGSSLEALRKLSGDSLGALWWMGWPWGGHGAIWAWEKHFAF